MGKTGRGDADTCYSYMQRSYDATPPMYSPPRCSVALRVQFLTIQPNMLLAEVAGQHVRDLFPFQLHGNVRRVLAVEPHVVYWVVVMETVVKGYYLVIQVKQERK